MEEFVKKVGEKFIENKLIMFPHYCYEARRVNFEKQKMLNSVGNPGGWSEDRSFKLDYEIPNDLYTFMTNMVYRDFWGEANEKVWRSFMKAIMRGDDPETLLKKVKIYYGSSEEMAKAWKV
jgi:hypothetical protein